MIDRSEKENVSVEESQPIKKTELSNNVNNQEDEVLETSFKSMGSSDDGFDQFKLRISDDDSYNKDGDLESQEETPGKELSDKMEVDETPKSDVSVKNGGDEMGLMENDEKPIVENGDEKIVEEEEVPVKVNGISGPDSEENIPHEIESEHEDEPDENDPIEESVEFESETVEEEQKDQAAEDTVDKKKDISENGEEANNTEEEQQKEDISAGEAPVEESVDNSRSASSPNSDGQTSGPASVSVRSASLESEGGAAASLASAPEEQRDYEQMDEESQQSTNSANFAADVAAAISRARKRPRASDLEETTATGAKKIRIDKRHCSDGEQESESSAPAKKERKSSLSECDLVKDLESFNLKQQVSNVLKNEKWKPPELTDEEKKRLEQSNAREKKMRESVLRVIQRNYKNMSVEDFEDTIYVALMDYFCHYNSSSTLQRKVLMLEKLVSRLQENYNRTFKQFCEAKYLLRRMVEIRKDEAKKCICKEKLPFKLIRSVAVQVQTARCRGGDLCPGAGVGLDPKFKTCSGSGVKATTSKKNSPEQNQPLVYTSDDVSVTAVSSKNKEGPGSGATCRSGSDTQGTSSPPPSPVDRPRHISVSVPPPPVPVPRWSHAQRSPAVRPRPSSELQNNMKSSPGTQPSTPNNQRTMRSSPAQSPSASPGPSMSAPVPSASKPSSAKQNQSIVIDLTDKDEEQVVPGRLVLSTRSPASSPAKPLQPIAPQPSATTRVVKTSVLSPMPQLPPLPAAPLYKAMVKRPPQPVLKVCKADQSGIMLSWTLRTNIPLTNEISLYQVYACQENAGVTREWSTVGDVKALPLPMACTLSQFREGHRYHFVVRAVDKFKVMGEFSHPASILLVSKNGTPNQITAAANNTRR